MLLNKKNLIMSLVVGSFVGTTPVLADEVNPLPPLNESNKSKPAANQVPETTINLDASSERINSENLTEMSKLQQEIFLKRLILSSKELQFKIDELDQKEEEIENPVFEPGEAEPVTIKDEAQVEAVTLPRVIAVTGAGNKLNIGIQTDTGRQYTVEIGEVIDNRFKVVSAGAKKVKVVSIVTQNSYSLSFVSSSDNGDVFN